MPKLLRVWSTAIACVVVSTPLLAGELTLTMRDGRVTLIADAVPVRQVLAEWARVGQARIVGAEKLAGPPITLRLENVPEHVALEAILRSASGYMVAERSGPVATLARFDRIMILPSSTPPAGAATAGPSGRPVGRVPTPPPVMSPPPMASAPEPAEAGDEAADEAQQAQQQPDEGRPPEANFDYANPQQFLQRRLEMLQQQQQQGVQQAPPTTFPGTVSPFATQPAATAPVSSARPGMVAQPTQPTTMNPYGIAVPQQSGVQQAPMQPDRAKYANPYQPIQPPQK